jgi:hypothetical protein
LRRLLSYSLRKGRSRETGALPMSQDVSRLGGEPFSFSTLGPHSHNARTASTVLVAKPVPDGDLWNKMTVLLRKTVVGPFYPATGLKQQNLQTDGID